MGSGVEIPKAIFCFALVDGPRICSVEGSVEQLLGFSAEELLSSRVSLRERIHFEDSDLSEMLFSPEGDDAGVAALRLRHADGRIRCCQARYDKRTTHQGRQLFLTLHHASSVWQKPGDGSSPHLRTMLDNTADPVFFIDRNHVIIAANDVVRIGIEKTFNERDPVGLTVYDFLPELAADKGYRMEKKALQEGVPVQDLHEVAQPGLGVSWIYIDYWPVKADTGEIVGLFCTARNLTKRMQGDESQEESQAASLVGSYVLDVQRGLFATSENLDTIMGIDKSYPHNIHGWENLIHPDDREELLTYFNGVVSTPGRIFSKEYRIVRVLDGELRWVHGLGRVDRDTSGRPLVMRGSVQDITHRRETEAALRETKERLQLFIEHAPAALAMFDNKMRYLAVSRRWRTVYNVSLDDLIGRCHYDVVPEIPERWKEAHRRGLAGESLRCDEDSLDRADGTKIWVRWELRPWRQADGAVGGIVLFLEDITEWKKAQERLQLAASVFSHASEAIVVTDLEHAIIEVNEAFSRVTGYSRDEVLGRSLGFLRSDKHDNAFYDEVNRSVRDDGRWSGELCTRGKDGSTRVMDATITTVFDCAGTPQYFVTLFFDLTPIKERERMLEHVAHYDSLTGLPNRVLLAERMRQAMAAARESQRSLAVIYFDLDNFKAVNDAYGRQDADALLVNVASRMKRVLREEDTLARLGGDEFVVILADIAGDEAAAPILERLLHAAAQPCTINGNELQLSASAGAAFYPQHQDVDADQLLRQADKAMYEAKIAGKARYRTFDPAGENNMRGRHVERERIRQGLKAGEFLLYYQPKVNMAKGKVIGAEALIRWNHPERGLLPPAAFLPLIEGDDLALEMGEWVMNAALSQIGKWSAAGHPVRVSVNVSARELQQPNFVQRLKKLLQAHPSVSPTQLGLEVLESSALGDVAAVSEIIQACQHMGVRVAIDDFGTGYSSLTYLKQLPAGVLKIDKSFVRDMLEDPDDLAILQGILGMATAFRRTPVAEGVESVEHGVLLLRLGCEVAQGFGIARPMPTEEFLPWCAEWRPDERWRNIAPVSPFDWPALVAEVELNAWARALERYIIEDKGAPPELEERRCRFTEWLRNEKGSQRGSSSMFHEVEKLHARAHVVARRATECKVDGLDAEALALVDDLLGLHAEITDRLRILYSGNEISSAA